MATKTHVRSAVSRSALSGRFVPQRNYAEKARAYIEGKVSYSELREAGRELSKSSGGDRGAGDKG